MRILTRVALAVLAVSLYVTSASALDFADLRRGLHPDAQSKAQRKEYWNGVKGTTVAWSGTLYKVRGGFRDIYKVFVQVDKQETGNYGAILTVSGQPEVTKLTKGSLVRFTGQLRRFKWSKPRPIKQPDGVIKRFRQFVVYVDDARIHFGKDK